MFDISTWLDSIQGNPSILLSLFIQGIGYYFTITRLIGFFFKKPIERYLGRNMSRYSLPASWQFNNLFVDGRLDRYDGIKTTSSASKHSMSTIRNSVYSPFCVNRYSSLTFPDSICILNISSFDQKKSAVTNFYFKDIDAGWISSVCENQSDLITPAEINKFRALLEIFEELIQNPISGRQAYFIQICCGAILGAKYEDYIYLECKDILLELTLKNPRLKHKSNLDKIESYINLGSILIDEKSNVESFRKKQLDELLEFVGNSLELDKFDKAIILCNYLNVT